MTGQFDALWKLAVERFLEIQAQPDPRFPHRMWVHYYRLCDKHGEVVGNCRSCGG